MGGVVERDGWAYLHRGNWITPARVTRGLRDGVVSVGAADKLSRAFFREDRGAPVQAERALRESAFSGRGERLTERAVVGGGVTINLGDINVQGGADAEKTARAVGEVLDKKITEVERRLAHLTSPRRQMRVLKNRLEFEEARHAADRAEARPLNPVEAGREPAS